MTDLSRQSAFMPTIKCSSCGNQVEISMMGDHVCKSEQPAEPLPPPPAPDLLGGALSSLKTSLFDKITRATPPSVDTSAANRAHKKKLDQITPLTASTGSQGISPRTPNVPNGRAGQGPSGEYYYDPAIADSPPLTQSRRPGGYGGLLEPEAPEVDSGYGTSPPKQGGLLNRMNSIAPGPFQMNRRPSAGNNLRSDRPGSRGDDARRPSTASSSGSNGRAPPKMPRKNGYGGFGPPQKDGEDFEPPSLGKSKRSETFPKPTPSPMDELPARTPSAPGMRQDRMRSATTNVENGMMASGARKPRPSFSIKDTSRPPPPRKSLIRPPTRDGSTTPSINLADEFGESNPYHSPSISQSSSQSGYSQRSSQRSQASSSTSPARSVGARRIPSDGPPPKIEDALDDFQMTIDALPLPPLGTGPTSRPRAPSAEDLTAPRPAPIPPPRQRPVPEALRLDPAAQTGQGLPSAATTSPPLRSPMFPPQSRRDPAIQAGQGSPPLRSPMFLENSIDNNINANNNNSNNDRQDPAVQEPLSTSGSTSSRRRPSHTHNRQPSRARGNCKACGEAITGKSIASADGRLTGRYHKACFVCATCQSPFAGTTFYVLGDRPYCERHYHALNGSLCGSCDRGIEGQYLEDEAARSKHHPGCFRCRDCGVVLRDGYFEVGGANLCERDAVRRVQMMQMRQQGQQGPPMMQGQGQGQFGGPPPFARGGGLPSGPSPPAPGTLNRPFGLPMGQRLMPGQALGRGGLGPMPRMEKRMTRLGMMGPA